jgi:hypothetical protein
MDGYLQIRPVRSGTTQIIRLKGINDIRTLAWAADGKGFWSPAAQEKDPFFGMWIYRAMPRPCGSATGQIASAKRVDQFAHYVDLPLSAA